MFENRNLHQDLLALALTAVTVFLGLSLATYQRADPVMALVPPLDRLYQPDVLVHPQASETSNLCGDWGALAADVLLTTFGIGAYYLVATLAAVDYLLLRRREIDSLPMRTTGWLLSLAGLPTLAAILAPTLSPGPVIGPGGYLGALGQAVLENHFAMAGSLILAGAVTIGGLLLCTEYMLFRLAAMAWARSLDGLLFGRRMIPKPKRKKAKVRTDVGSEQPDEAEANAAGNAGDDQADQGDPVAMEEPALVTERDGLRVKVRGHKPVKQSENDAEDDRDDEPLNEETDAAEANDETTAPAEDAPAETVTRRTDPPLKVRKPHKKRQQEQQERDEVIAQLNEASESTEVDALPYEPPPLSMLIEGEDVAFDRQEQEVRRKAKILEKTFANFGFQVKVVEIETGPVIAQYEVELEAGLRLSKITGLADDLAIALRVPSVRIVAPIPGKNTVGIEVPNEARQTVRLREVMEEAGLKAKQMQIPLYLGKDVSGNPLTVDLSKLPHLLIAGRTGTGKSVCLNAIINSMLMTRGPDEVRMLMIDPKMVELSGYGTLPHLMHPVVTDMKKAEAILAWAVDKMEERYSLLAKAGVRHISSYNQLGEDEICERLGIEDEEEREAVPTQLPFIVIVADEIADMMMTAGKEVEHHIIRLAQKSRAVGIHLILATQKPTVDVITGLIKSNLPARIAFQVASRTDSRVVLDEMGAERLLGNGDMLFLWPGTSMLLRGQGTYVADEEIDAIVDYCSTGEQNFASELVNLKVESDGAGEGGIEAMRKRDELYESAIDVVVREGRGSVSLLQRSLGIGYGRAARLIDFMAEDGIVGPYSGSKAREVTISIDEWEQMQGYEPDDEPVSRRTNKVRPHDEEDLEADYDDKEASEDDAPFADGDFHEEEEWRSESA